MSSHTLEHIAGGIGLVIGAGALLGMAVFAAWVAIVAVGIWWEDTGHPRLRRLGTRIVDALERRHARKVKAARR